MRLFQKNNHHPAHSTSAPISRRSRARQQREKNRTPKRALV